MSFTSPFPTVSIPNVSVYDFLFRDFDSAHDAAPALIDGTSGEALTYRELVAAVNGVAGALVSRGLSLGEVVGLHAPNMPAFAVAFHAMLRAGGVATTINALYTTADIKATDRFRREIPIHLLVVVATSGSCNGRSRHSLAATSSCSTTPRASHHYGVCSPRADPPQR